MKSEITKMAKLLRTSEEVVLELKEKMEKVSGQKGVIKKIVQENDQKIKQKLIELKLGDRPIAQQVYEALINKVKATDQALFNHFHQPDFSTTIGCRSLINAIKELTGDLPGFYLKEDKAKELFKQNPPQQIMANLGYGDDIDKMLANEDIFEIFCALRFAEDSQWLNDVFFKPYQDFRKEDFEQRKIKVMVLPERWSGIGQKFLGKKLHHMSHLKELGVVFVIPLPKENPGETLYFFFMALHYIYEVDWHSRLFRKYSKEMDFAEKLVKALKVEVSDLSLPDKERASWRILPKYLGKANSNDSRLAEPHISSEAWNYTMVVSAIDRFAQHFPNSGLGFWQGLEVAGEYFPSDHSKEETLISFDLFDNGISLLQQSGFESKYLYHQQEALWNEVFIKYMGEEKLDELMMENLDNGFVVL